MRPVLYPHSETQFSNRGLGTLADCVSCKVTEERNGAFELEMVYPISGLHYGDIALRQILLCKASPTGEPQPFRIYRISRPMNGQVTIYAQHISYDLSGFPLSPFTAATCNEAMTKLKQHEVINSNFTFATDKTTIAAFSLDVPQSVRYILGGSEGSLIDEYGGEWEFNRFSCYLHNARGADNGVRITYGKNLISLKQEENCESVYTGVLPYYYNDGTLVQGAVQYAAGTFNYTKILSKDFTDEYDDVPTAAQLNAKAQAYIISAEIGVPQVSLSVSYAQLSGVIEQVGLCDTVHVNFPAMGVTATAKVIKTTFDALLDRFISVDIGSTRYSIADTIAKQQQSIQNNPTVPEMQKAIISATELITGAKGGHIVFGRDADGKPNELYIMDTDNVSTAQKVWRYNLNGWGVSKNGIAGPYELAAVFDNEKGGHIIADMITAGTLNCDSVNVTNINGENIRNQTIGNSQISAGAVQGSAGGGVQSIQSYSVGGISLSSYSVSSAKLDSYCGGGVGGGWEAADAFAGRISVNYLFANLGVKIAGHSTFLGQVTIAGQVNQVVRWY